MTAVQASSTEIRVVLPMAPFGKARPRATCTDNRGRILRNKQGKPIAKIYMPPEYVAWVKVAKMRCIGLLARRWCLATAKEPVGLECDLFASRPKGKPKHVPRDLWKSGVRYLATKTPDRDNAVGSIMDALNGIAWHDDCQVQLGRVYMWVCAEGGKPRCELTLRRLGLHGGPA